ncbi:hypothetical protein F511_39788 [Dorcoceras hygrometricum]|uniref:Uncharacterized protein n=1 Tax=Dorcoceras hygrometricum TaxID=472368 RepID=A0A2Z7AYL3_9LAMI|nr:hypothetical protein F511_39788 [Dorcoceras hygrometricum]
MGIDQLALHSIQLGYLKILKMEPVSQSQLGGRHSNPVVTTPMIALDFSGTTHLSASHNVALNLVINQSITQAQDVCIITSADFITSIAAMSTLKAVKSAQFVPPTADFYLNRYTKTRHKQLKQNLTPVLPLNKVLTVHTKLRTAGNSYPEAETNGRTIEFHCTKKPATSRSSPRSFYSLNWVTIGRETHKESSANNISQNNGGERRQSTEKSYGEQQRNRRNLTTETSFCSQRNQLQPSDVAFTKEHQSDAASTNQNDATEFQQLTTDSFQNNQQLVTLNNSNDDLNKSVAPKTLRFNLTKRRRLTSTTGSSQTQKLIALKSAVNTKRLTNKCRVLVNPRTRASFASRFLIKRYY